MHLHESVLITTSVARLPVHALNGSLRSPDFFPAPARFFSALAGSLFAV